MNKKEVSKKRMELINSPYLNRQEIKILLGMTRKPAEDTYNQADAIDSQMKYRQYKNKVRIESVLKVTEKSYDLLLKQIKNADALAQQSAE